MKLHFLIFFVCSVTEGRLPSFKPSTFKPSNFNLFGKKPSTSKQSTSEPSTSLTLSKLFGKPSGSKPSTSEPSTSEKSTGLKKLYTPSKFALKFATKYATRSRFKGNTAHGRQHAMLEQFATPDMLTTLASMIIPFVIWELGQQKLNQDKNSTVQTHVMEDQASPKVCLDCYLEFEKIWISIDAKMQPFCEKYEELNYYDAATKNCTEEGVENFFDKKTAEIFKDFGGENNKCLKAKSEYLIEMENKSRCPEKDDLILRCIYDRYYQLEETEKSCEIIEN